MDSERWRGLQAGERPYRGAAWFYAEYRHRPTSEFARLLSTTLGWAPGRRVLDLGAGPAQVALQLAPFVGEVVVMDPEPDMLDEGRRRAAAAGVDNLRFVLGGSDDLESRAEDLRGLAGVTISSAFHWMRDQDHVLRVLDGFVDSEDGAVAIVGFANDPDPNQVWLDQSPWNLAARICAKYTAGVPEGPHPRGRHDPFPEILERSPFSNVELITHEYEATIEPSVAAAIGFQYTLSNVLARLGSRREAFEAEVRAALAGADLAPFRARLIDSALVGRRSR